MWLWLAEATRIVYSEIASHYAGINCCDDAHETACTCSNCIYFQMMIYLEEHLEANEISCPASG